jgi:hypothetical protein
VISGACADRAIGQRRVFARHRGHGLARAARCVFSFRQCGKHRRPADSTTPGVDCGIENRRPPFSGSDRPS